MLAVVAVATAWTGFQATKWDGRQAFLYGRASSYRFEADAASTYGGQELSADAGIFTAWLQAHAAGNTSLQSQYERRFTPDFSTAFDALARDQPVHQPQGTCRAERHGAVPQPLFCQSDGSENNKASAAFDEGTDARETGDKYVRRHSAVRLGPVPGRPSPASQSPNSPYWLECCGVRAACVCARLRSLPFLVSGESDRLRVNVSSKFLA